MRIELRYAIWLAHGKRDIYSGRLIENFNDLEIDHIIPQSIAIEELNEKILKYELGNEFSIDSIENLLPTFKLHNRQKSEMVFNESSERFFLTIAAGKKEKVENELSKIIKKFKSREKNPFEEYYRIVDTNKYGAKPTYFNSKSHVALNGFLPSKFGDKGSCCIEFYEVGSMMALGHELILVLINWIEHSTLESKISYFYNKKSKSGFIVLGTTSLHLKKNAYDQLMFVLADFLLVYLNYFKRYEGFLGINKFQQVGSEEIFLIKRINEVEWQSLVEYSYQHDLDMQCNTPYYFNANPHCLIALDKNETAVKFKISHSLDHASPANKVMVLWHIPSMREREFIEKGIVWTANETLNWVEDILMDLYKKNSPEIKRIKFSKISTFLRYLFSKNTTGI